MAALVIKKLPDPIHRALKARAKINHRSMTQEVVAALESIYLAARAPQAFYVSENEAILNASKVRRGGRVTEVRKPAKVEHPVPFKLGFKVTDAMINRAKREGRS